MKIIEKLKERYPIEVKLRNDLKNVLLITIIPPLILFFFQPFGVFLNFEYLNLKLWLAVFGFGILSGTLTLVFWVILPSLFKSYFENLRVWQALLFLLLFIVILSSSIYTYIKLLEGNNNFFWKDYFTVLPRFVIIGLFTSVILTMINQTRRLKSNLQLAEEINNRLKKENIAKEVIIKTEKERETFVLSEESFLFAQSTDNYCMIHMFHSGHIHKKLYRLSLKSLEIQTSEIGNFVRCHRSFMVNTKMIVLTEGNSRGLELTLKYADQTIPVSRGYMKILSKKI